ncbi:hypothetical protein PILCRDRAFT_817584 [Piloderma croceum F 1598]|uniref:Uncharacterized protein n=1 Tax=Piloderma croceum (strain F 1598) TaxID=765440 RepID=A0A0C3G2E8_PILCF|nr:hypothetical protein PILCRDRAFT_817584 [Piloderma croceum F 1598]
MSGGMGGVVPFDDDMIVSKPAIICYTGQIFFNFLAMACFASVASFQAKWKVGPSGLTAFAVFLSVAGLFMSSFMLAVPVIYEKYDRLSRLARLLKELRVAFILAGASTIFALLIAFIVTISAWTEPGCKNADNDPNAKLGDAFKSGLDGWCSTKKAGAIFFWFAFGFWAGSFALLIMDWRSGKLDGPRDPPFNPTSVHEHVFEEGEGDEESTYEHVPPVTQRNSAYDDSNVANAPYSDTAGAERFRDNDDIPPPPGNPTAYSSSSPTGIQAGRPSMDAYGAFSDPAPSGFGGGAPSPGRYEPAAPPSPSAAPPVSRTMQYADPYAAVRATIGSPTGGGSGTPPSYESYQGYQ